MSTRLIGRAWMLIGGVALMVLTGTASTSLAALTFYCDATGCYTFISGVWVPVAPDADGDGYQSTVDCNDSDPAIHPGAIEVCDPDNVDEDCDGLANDADPDVVGKATFYEDADGDGYGNVSAPSLLCAATPGTSSDNTDCDDNYASIHPGAQEVPGDGIDEDCDGHELCFVDFDGDGYRPDATATVVSDDFDCGDPGEATAASPVGDCDDSDASIHPAAHEHCGDGIDNNCNGNVDSADADCSAGRKCLAAKAKATGKKVFDKMKCHQKAYSKGVALDPVCIAKAETKFAAAIAKADTLGACSGAAMDLEGDVDQCVSTMLSRFGATPCTEGAFRCDGMGFDICSAGTWVYRDCAPGTACRESGSSIVCDVPM